MINYVLVLFSKKIMFSLKKKSCYRWPQPQPLSWLTNTQPFIQTGQIIELCY